MDPGITKPVLYSVSPSFIKRFEVFYVIVNLLITQGFKPDLCSIVKGDLLVDILETHGGEHLMHLVAEAFDHPKGVLMILGLLQCRVVVPDDGVTGYYIRIKRDDEVSVWVNDLQVSVGEYDWDGTAAGYMASDTVLGPFSANGHWGFRARQPHNLVVGTST